MHVVNNDTTIKNVAPFSFLMKSAGKVNMLLQLSDSRTKHDVLA